MSSIVQSSSVVFSSVLYSPMFLFLNISSPYWFILKYSVSSVDCVLAEIRVSDRRARATLPSSVLLLVL
eukprot:SAG31_NODE_2550_length_5515_cov_5.400849_3_plen_69_part_00